MMSSTSRPLFDDEELDLLLSEYRHSIRTFTLCWLAFRLGLGARQLSNLDVRDVSPDGKEPAHAVYLKPARRYRSGREGLVPLPIDTRGVVRRYLNWRRQCVHFRLPMRTFRDGTGKERCDVCREPIDFLACPLFVTPGRGRLTAKTIQNGFAVTRDALGLRPALRFESLRDTFHARYVAPRVAAPVAAPTKPGRAGAARPALAKAGS